MKKKFKLEKDFLDFLEICNKHLLKYLIIGGYAVGIYGYPRYNELLILKADACRKQDLADIDKLKSRNKNK